MAELHSQLYVVKGISVPGLSVCICVPANPCICITLVKQRVCDSDDISQDIYIIVSSCSEYRTHATHQWLDHMYMTSVLGYARRLLGISGCSWFIM